VLDRLQSYINTIPQHIQSYITTMSRSTFYTPVPLTPPPVSPLTPRSRSRKNQGDVRLLYAHSTPFMLTSYIVSAVSLAFQTPKKAPQASGFTSTLQTAPRPQVGRHRTEPLNTKPRKPTPLRSVSSIAEGSASIAA